MKKQTLLRSASILIIGFFTVVQIHSIDGYASINRNNNNFQLDTKSYSTCVGTKYILLAEMNNPNAVPPDIISSDNSIVSASLIINKKDQRGYLYEIVSNGIGTAKITLTSSAMSASLPVYVTTRKPTTIDTSNCEILKGDTYSFMVSTNVKDKQVPTPYVSDKSIADIQFSKKIGTGKYLFCLTALKDGTTDVGVSVCGKKTTFPVTVKSSVNIPIQELLQNSELPTGCEITSLTNVLNYLGYPVSKTYMADNVLVKDDTRKVYEGKLLMPDPSKAFVGNPRNRFNSFGCFAPVITNAATSYLESAKSDLKAVNITGSTPLNIYRNLLQNRPVIVWATMEMKDPRNGLKWYDFNTLKPIEWISGEHCLVLTGVTDENVTVMDPLLGIKTYNRSLFEKRYAQLGNQAVVIN